MNSENLPAYKHLNAKSSGCKNSLRFYLFIICLIVTICLFCLSIFSLNSSYAQQEVSPIVVDGDTLELASRERVRLIGIDTPEMHMSDKLYRQAQSSKSDIQTIMRLGEEAYKFTRNLVEGKRVRLEFDVERYDKYGRLLAYVYLNNDGTFVNAKIIQQGYASLLTIPPNVKYAGLFRTLYNEARENNRGLWKEE